MEELQIEALQFFVLGSGRVSKSPTHDESKWTFQDENYVTGSKDNLAG